MFRKTGWLLAAFMLMTSGLVAVSAPASAEPIHGTNLDAGEVMISSSCDENLNRLVSVSGTALKDDAATTIDFEQDLMAVNSLTLDTVADDQGFTVGGLYPEGTYSNFSLFWTQGTESLRIPLGQVTVPGCSVQGTVATATATPGECTTDNTMRVVTFAGVMPQTSFGGTSVAVLNGTVELSNINDTSLPTYEGDQEYSIPVNLAPGTYTELNVKYGGAVYEEVYTLDIPDLVVGQCTLMPTLTAVSPGDCLLTVTYEGVAPPFRLSATGKQVLTVMSEARPALGRIDYVLDAEGAPTKGRKANTYTVTVTSGDGLRTKAPVVCP